MLSRPLCIRLQATAPSVQQLRRTAYSNCYWPARVWRCRNSEGSRRHRTTSIAAVPRTGQTGASKLPDRKGAALRKRGQIRSRTIAIACLHEALATSFPSGRTRSVRSHVPRSLQASFHSKHHSVSGIRAAFNGYIGGFRSTASRILRSTSSSVGRGEVSGGRRPSGILSLR